MKKNLLAGLFKANLPHWVVTCYPLWFGAIFFALGRFPTPAEWQITILFLATVTVILGIAEFANTYADREEDGIFVPSNPIITGELSVETAKKAFIAQNIAAGILLTTLYILTYNLQCTLAVLLGWIIGLTYSLPPFRFKERTIAPFPYALGLSLVPVVAWLLFKPLNLFILAFMLFFFTHTLAFGITTKLRKTAELLKHNPTSQPNPHNISSVGFKVKVKISALLEIIISIIAIILVALFWYHGIFNLTLTIGLLTFPLLFTILFIIYRIKSIKTVKDFIKNQPTCSMTMGMIYLFSIFAFLTASLINLIHWALAILPNIIVLLLFAALLKYTHPYGAAYKPIPAKE